MKFDEMIKAVNETKSVLYCADQFVNQIAELMIGRLRGINSHRVLRALKRELNDYNSHTRQWK